MRSLNPFRDLERPREVWAWGMYDLANQSFTLLINTMLFAIFFKEVVVGTSTEALSDRGDRVWSTAVAVSMLIVVVVSPILGAIADCRGRKKQFLIGSGVVCVALTCSFALLGPGQLWLAILLYIPANIAYQLGENFLASFLPDVAGKRNIGRVSAIGWTMGYVGAMMLLAIIIAGMLTLGMQATESWPPFFVLAGVWFLLGMLAPALILRNPPRQMDPVGEAPVIKVALRRVLTTLRSASQYRQLTRFLIAFFVYGLGVQTVIFFASIIAKELVFTDPDTASTKLAMFIAQITITAGLAAYATSKFQDKIGARRTVLIYLGVWTASTLAFAAMCTSSNPAEWVFWMIGNGFGFGLGGIGTASRSMVARFTPRHKSAEFFGLWGMTYKLAAVVGVSSFGQVKAAFGDVASLVLLAGFFVVGLVLVLPINETAGVRTAKREERTHSKRLANP